MKLGDVPLFVMTTININNAADCYAKGRAGETKTRTSARAIEESNRAATKQKLQHVAHIETSCFAFCFLKIMHNLRKLLYLEGTSTRKKPLQHRQLVEVENCVV